MTWYIIGSFFTGVAATIATFVGLMAAAQSTIDRDAAQMDVDGPDLPTRAK
jgi:hypothetical protein